MISEKLLAHLDSTAANIFGWAGLLNEEQRARLAETEITEEVNKLSYLDHWWRSRRLSPLILKVIERFNDSGDVENARFWIEKLDEEIGNDLALRDDLVRAFGSEVALDHALGLAPMTPPSIALLGYFEWQAAYGDPRMGIALTIFQDWHSMKMERVVRDGVSILLPTSDGTPKSHLHGGRIQLGTGLSYIDAQFEQGDVASLLWSIDFAALCAREAQVWVASGVLGRRA